MKGILVMLLLAMKLLPCNAIGAYGAVDFTRLTNRNGLSNSQVNAIFKDQQAYGLAPNPGSTVLMAFV